MILLLLLLYITAPIYGRFSFDGGWSKAHLNSTWPGSLNGTSHGNLASPPLPEHLHEASSRRLPQKETCISLLKPFLPKVALLFLAYQTVHHEQLWSDWLSDAADLAPTRVACNETLNQCFQDHVLQKPARSGYDEQGLFSVYIHTKPDAHGFYPGSVFHGRVLPKRIKTKWGEHSLSEATKLLLKAALQDPLNQRFQLICGTSIPLRPSIFVHKLLIAEPRSRFQSFFAPTFDNQTDAFLAGTTMKLPISMHEEFPDLHKHVAFHHQFWSLNRRHAEIVAEDAYINHLFRRHCLLQGGRREGYEPSKYCISDESYAGIVLRRAYNDKIWEEITDNPALVPFWKEFKPEEISHELLLQARGTQPDVTLVPDVAKIYRKKCTVSEKYGHLYIPSTVGPGDAASCGALQETVLEQPAPWTQPEDESDDVSATCPLFGRKFPKSTEEAVYKVLHELHIVPDRKIVGAPPPEEIAALVDTE
eukprot:jgi/Botrbrau1/14010/Bobra.0296s0004.1